MPAPPNTTPQRVWRWVLLGALACWLGGLAFYALLVIPTGAEVLGGHTAFGFITRHVASKVNLLGAGLLVALLANWLRARDRRSRRILASTWLLMAVCQSALFALHPWLEQLLDTAHQRVIDADGFYVRHRLYLWTTMIQWVAGAVHFGQLAGSAVPGAIFSRERA